AAPPGWPAASSSACLPRAARSGAGAGRGSPPAAGSTAGATWERARRSACGCCGTERLVARWPFLLRVRGRFPVLTDGGRIIPPRAELRLRELRVPGLEPDAVRVSLTQVGDQDLARVLVLPALRDLEVDLEEGVGVAVEDGRDVVFRHAVHVFQPVDVRCGPGGI